MIINNTNNNDDIRRICEIKKSNMRTGKHSTLNGRRFLFMGQEAAFNNKPLLR